VFGTHEVVEPLQRLASRQLYAASTTAEPARQVGAVTAAEADAELVDAGDEDVVRLARPRLLPPRPPAPGWVLPRPPTEGRR
jgi:putative transposase